MKERQKNYKEISQNSKSKNNLSHKTRIVRIFKESLQKMSSWQA